MSKEKIELANLADKYFNVYLFPLFSELAYLKQVNIRVDPYRNNSLAILLALVDREMEQEPQRNGFSKIEMERLGHGEVIGELIWSFEPRGKSWRNPSTWRHLSIGVTHEAITTGHIESLDLLTVEGRSTLENRFFKHVQHNGYGGSSDAYPSDFDSAP